MSIPTHIFQDEIFIYIYINSPPAQWQIYSWNQNQSGNSSENQLELTLQVYDVGIATY